MNNKESQILLNKIKIYKSYLNVSNFTMIINN